MTWTFRVSDRIQTKLDEFENVAVRFKSGAINEGQFRIVRVPAGIYDTTRERSDMLWARFPASGAPPAQVRRLGEASAKFGSGLLHITTRQEFQIHRVPLDSIIPALRSLAITGLSTKGGGGQGGPPYQSRRLNLGTGPSSPSAAWAQRVSAGATSETN